MNKKVDAVCSFVVGRPSTQASAFSFEVRAQPMNPWIWFLLSTAKQ